jgi:four helix bundle protein
MGVADFRDLDVYKTAFATAMRIFELTKRFPDDEKYSMTQQARRSSRSVCSNIGEAWRKRRYAAAFVSKLSDADTEAGETQVWLDFAKACGYITPAVYDDLRDRCDHACRMLVRMMERPDLWCHSRKKKPEREDDEG